MFDERKESSHSKMVNFIGTGKNVLEVGCGAGFVAERLKENGCTVSAVEMDKGKAARAKKFCEKLVVGNAEEIDFAFGNKSFDVVLFGDVLEHLRNPFGMLQKVKPLLKDNGFIVVSLPNVANWKVRMQLLFGRFDYADQGILDKAHLRFFTRRSAESLLNAAGYEVVKIGFVPSFPFPLFKGTLSMLSWNMFSFQFVFVARKRGRKA